MYDWNEHLPALDFLTINNFDVTFPPLANSNPWLQHSPPMQTALLAR